MSTSNAKKNEFVVLTFRDKFLKTGNYNRQSSQGRKTNHFTTKTPTYAHTYTKHFVMKNAFFLPGIISCVTEMIIFVMLPVEWIDSPMCRYGKLTWCVGMSLVLLIWVTKVSETGTGNSERSLGGKNIWLLSWVGNFIRKVDLQT